MATTEFPTLDEGLIDKPARTAVTVAAAASIDLEKVDLAKLAIAKLGDWRPIVAKLKADNTNTVHDLSTQAKVDDAISLRHRTINKPLAAARKMEEALASDINGARKKLGAELKALEAGYADAALPLTEQIEAAQKIIDDKKAADKLAEDNRLAGLRATVDQIMQKWLDRASAEGITAERIGAGMAMLADLAMPAELADVFAHWNAAQTATIAAMTKLQLNKLLADKAERDREDADIDRLNELANDCVARGAQYIEDSLDEFDALDLVLSPVPRVQTVATAARARMVALLETAREEQAKSDRLEAERMKLEAAQASAAATVAAAIADAPDSAARMAENPGPEPEATPDTTYAPAPVGRLVDYQPSGHQSDIVKWTEPQQAVEAEVAAGSAIAAISLDLEDLAYHAKEQEAADALAGALAAISTAILKCGDAGLSFMNAVEPLMHAHELVGDVRKIVMGEA